MDIADFILQLEADLKSEANVTDQEMADQENIEDKLSGKLRAPNKKKKQKDPLKGRQRSEDDLLGIEDEEESDSDAKSKNVSSEEDDDVPMEIDLSKSDSWTDTKDAFNRLRAGES